MAGRFIVLEGGDGVGKTTHVALLSTWLDAAGISHTVVREPGGTPLGEAIRQVVLDRTDLKFPYEAELLLILAARAALVREVIHPALQRGDTVIADRFALSTLAYQSFGRGLDLDQVRLAIEVATGGLQPDLYVVLDLPVEESVERGHRDEHHALDRIEQEGKEFRQTIREAYLALVESEPAVALVSAQGPLEEVQRRIRDLLSARFRGAFAGATGDTSGAHAE